MSELLRKALEMRDAINDVELACAGIDSAVDKWEGAGDHVMVKIRLGSLRQLARAYPAINRIMNSDEFNPTALSSAQRKDEQ